MRSPSPALVHTDGCHGRQLATDERVRVRPEVFGVAPQVAPDAEHPSEVLVDDGRGERLEDDRAVVADPSQRAEEGVEVDRARPEVAAVALTDVHVPKP